jgi:CheY-like chemotaxis protein
LLRLAGLQKGSRKPDEDSGGARRFPKGIPGMKAEDTKHKILIVDDVPVNIKMLEEALSSDYRTSSATDGPSALDIATSDLPPSLILLDIVMPGMDGYEVCRRLKADKRTKDIPVIFITGKNQKDDEAKGLELGAVDYMSKPFSMAILKARVRNHVELKGTHDKLKQANRRLALAYAQMRDWKDRLGMELQREEIGFLINENGQILGVTERALEVTGRKRIELLGSEIVDLTDRSSRQELQKALREAWIGVFRQISVGITKNELVHHKFETKLMNVNMDNGRMLLMLMQGSPDGAKSQNGAN